jgi:AhpD family alkylhydroperoxidase
MAKDFGEVTRSVSSSLRTLRRNAPDLMTAFDALGDVALRPGMLDKKTKELIALALGVASRCDACLGYHVRALVRLGAQRQEIEEALGVAVYMGGGPSLMCAADTLDAFDQFAATVRAA